MKGSGIRDRLTGWRTVAAAVAALASISSQAEATPWTLAKGHFYSNLSVSTLSATSFYAPDFGSEPLTSRYSQLTVGFYGEVGLVDRYLTLMLDGTLFRRSALEDQGHTRGLGDWRIGLWSGLLRAPFPVSVGVIVGLPTGDPVPEAGAGADADAQQIAAILPTGDGEWDVELAAAAGYSYAGRGWWPLHHYARAQLGYWIRTSPREVAFGEIADFADAINWQLELGTRAPWRVLRRLWVVFRLFGSESFASEQEAATNASGLGNGVTHTSVAVQLYGRIVGGLGAAFDVSGALRARSLPAAPMFRFALSYKH